MALFISAQQQFPEFLEKFNRRITDTRGALVHQVAGLGGPPALDAVLGCLDHDGRVCKASALGGVPRCFTSTTGDTHEDLGRSVESIELISAILQDPGMPTPETLSAPMMAAGGESGSSIEPGELYASLLAADSSYTLKLYSDTTGSVIIILNNELPGIIDFQVEEPDGDLITPASAGALPGIRYESFGDGEGHQIQAYVFEEGQIGDYTAYMVNASPGEEVSYSLQIFLDTTVTLDGDLHSSEIAIGERVTVMATVLSEGEEGGPVLGAASEARITRPDGGYEVVTLLDDGQGPDETAGDGIYSGFSEPFDNSGIYLVTVRASGSLPFDFLREENLTLHVRSSSARFNGDFELHGEDGDSDGVLEGILLVGGILAEEAGAFIINAELTDLAGNPVAAAGVNLEVEAPGSVSFQIFFEGEQIFGAGLDGPYRLSRIELLDGNRGFILGEVIEIQSDAFKTDAYTLDQFDASASYVRGDANGDTMMDLSDAVAILLGLFSGKFKIPCADAADTNADGSLDLTDVIFLLQVLFHDGSPIPSPHPDCGKAPALGCEWYDPCNQP